MVDQIAINGVTDIKTVACVGIPPDIAKAVQFLSDSQHHLIVLTRNDAEDAAMMALRDTWKQGMRLTWLKWRNDDKLAVFLHEHLSMFIGAGFTGDREDVERLSATILKVINLYNFDLRSAKVLHSERAPLKNALRNMARISNSTVNLKTERDKWKGHQGVLVAAGPSLEGQIEALKGLPADAIVTVVGRSLMLLQKHGISPQYVVSCEQFDWDKAIFEGIGPTGDTILCHPASISPEVLNAWSGPTMCIVDHNLRELMGWEHSLDGGNSVAHHAFNVLSWVGCDPIYFVGVDFGYPEGEGKTHADGTYHDGWPEEVRKSERLPQQELWVEAADGSRLRSSFAYRDFATLMEILVTKSGKRAYTTNPRSHKMKGVEVSTLPARDVAATCPAAP